MEVVQMSTTEDKLFGKTVEFENLKFNIVELKTKIQNAIDNIRAFKEDAGTNKAVSETYDDGRADAYAVVLGWLEELEI